MAVNFSGGKALVLYALTAVLKIKGVRNHVLDGISGSQSGEY